MTPILASLGLLLAGAAACALASARPRAARLFLVASLAGAALLAFPAALQVLASGAAPDLTAPLALPGAAFHVGADGLSACFLMLVILVCACAGLYGEGYLEASGGHVPAGPARFFFLLLAASMGLLVLARNAVLFLIAWEAMALSAFFLVSAEHGRAESRRAALIYLLCAHTGSLCLVALFALLGRNAGSLDFAAFAAAAPLKGWPQAAALALALVGFGMKAGFLPLHIWLQEAHPAAPSHASAAMSGVMIEMGVYGLLRILALLSPVPRSWAVLMAAVGLATALFGILFAMVQRDVKRLLAYSSIENVGIILLALGLGFIGLADANRTLAVLGFAGAVLHTLNHGLFKSLLFLSAGAVYQALGSRDLERGGGLQRRMPWTGLFTWIGAGAICGLPPFNGFMGEWLIYSWLLAPQAGRGLRWAAWAAAVLALVGALAVVAFTKAYGLLFLGSPRSQRAGEARDPGWLMLGPMAFLAALCVAVGLFPGPALAASLAAAGASGTVFAAAAEQWKPLLGAVAALGLSFWGLCALLWFLRHGLARPEELKAAGTWGCGFSVPSSRMQYSASSYADAAAKTFAVILATTRDARAPLGYWPQEARFSSATPDPALDRLVPEAAAYVAGWARAVRRIQHGRLQLYLLYISSFLVAILLWKL